MHSQPGDWERVIYSGGWERVIRGGWERVIRGDWERVIRGDWERVIRGDWERVYEIYYALKRGEDTPYYKQNASDRIYRYPRSG